MNFPMRPEGHRRQNRTLDDARNRCVLPRCVHEARFGHTLVETFLRRSSPRLRGGAWRFLHAFARNIDRIGCHVVYYSIRLKEEPMGTTLSVRPLPRATRTQQDLDCACEGRPPGAGMLPEPRQPSFATDGTNDASSPTRFRVDLCQYQRTVRHVRSRKSGRRPANG